MNNNSSMAWSMWLHKSRASETSLAWRNTLIRNAFPSHIFFTAISAHVAAFGLRQPAVWVACRRMWVPVAQCGDFVVLCDALLIKKQNPTPCVPRFAVRWCVCVVYLRGRRPYYSVVVWRDRLVPSALDANALFPVVSDSRCITGPRDHVNLAQGVLASPKNIVIVVE